MTALKLFFIFLLTSSLPFLSRSECGDEQCGSDRYSPMLIRFPFRVIDRQPKSCGYPGFDVRCDAQNRTLLQLPNSVFLKIIDFDYEYQKIVLTDPDDCLPKKFLSLNFSSTNSPFYATYYREVAFFNCSGRYDNMSYNETIDFELRKVDCLSGLNYTVYAVSSLWAVSLLSSSCQWTANISVPHDYGSYYPLDSYVVTLYWDEPRCGQCEKIHHRCHVKSRSVHDFQCTSDIYPDNEPTSDAIALPLGVGLPLFAAAVAGLIGWLRYERRRNESGVERSMTTWLQNDGITTTGIDRSTLDSFPRVVIGESGRLITPNDNTCPVCLTEYQINQVLEILPHCLHRFHATCIDQWLVINGTCPICRVPPS